MYLTGGKARTEPKCGPGNLPFELRASPSTHPKQITAHLHGLRLTITITIYEQPMGELYVVMSVT